jgi:hypothetical protein
VLPPVGGPELGERLVTVADSLYKKTTALELKSMPFPETETSTVAAVDGGAVHLTALAFTKLPFVLTPPKRQVSSVEASNEEPLSVTTVPPAVLPNSGHTA